jgi:hypothetical protein
MSAIREVDLRRRRVDAVITRALSLAGHSDGPQLQADFARHLCVLVSGFVEKSAVDLVLAYANDKTARQVLSLLDASLKRLSNLDTERLLQVVGSLDAGWRQQLDAFITDQHRQALNSIVGLRNDIAHGGGGSLSLDQVQRYWLSVQEVIAEVERIVFTNPRAISTRRSSRR